MALYSSAGGRVTCSFWQPERRIVIEQKNAARRIKTILYVTEMAFDTLYQ